MLSDDERQRLLDSIGTFTDPYVKVFFLILVDTGCRQSEALAAKWDDLDLDAGYWTIPSPKSGRPQVLPLPDSAIAALRTLPQRQMNPHIFPGRHGRKHRTTVACEWESLRVAANLSKVTMHDLRRDYGLRVAKKSGILEASRLLRHSDTRITSKVYAPLGVEDLRAITNDVSVGGKVLPMPVARKKK